jgi:uncharacterized damage-inducible protein DinB
VVAVITPRYCQVMAAYTQHMNRQLFDTCSELDDGELRRERGAFFGSIYRTAEHILFGDLAWMSRFVGEDFRGDLAIGDGVCAHVSDLRQRRNEFDGKITEWAGTLEQSWLDGLLTWTSAADQKERTVPTALAVMHMFNHGTHHRGQLTTLMSQAGLDPGITDLPWIGAARALAVGG